MAVQEKGAVQTKKRKNPPTFSHLPRDRALKLKKSWIEKKKLKSRWKAQKRKEGLDSGWAHPRISPGHSRSTGSAEESGSEAHAIREELSHNETDSESSSSSNEAAKNKSKPAPKKARFSRQQNNDDKPRRLSEKAKGKQLIRSALTTEGDGHANEVGVGNPEDTKPSSLRDLTRLAYSRESLHTFKADPLHRRKGAVSSTQSHSSKAGQRKGRDTDGDRSEYSRRGREGGRGFASGRGRGRGREVRGQPNMKLRMEAMLERIKRDYS